MRRYKHKCQIKILIFYSTFSLSSQYLIQLFLSLLTVFSLRPMFSPSFFFRSSPSRSKQRYGGLTDQAADHWSPSLTISSFYVRHCSTVRWPHRSMVRHRSTSLFGILIALSPRRSRNHWSRHIDLGFVGLCRWMWMWVCVGGGRCCGNGGCAVVVVVDDEDEDDRE